MFYNSSQLPVRTVLDTNVVIDFLHFDDPRTCWLRNALADGRLTCLTDAVCLAELERVAAYPQFGLDEAGRAALLADYRRFVRIATAARETSAGPIALPRCRDADDQKFLELAARTGAALLLTRDKELLRLARGRRALASALPFAILTAEAAGRLFATTAEDPAHGV